jgi:hypothetical protein
MTPSALIFSAFGIKIKRIFVTTAYNVRHRNKDKPTLECFPFSFHFKLLLNSVGHVCARHGGCIETEERREKLARKIVGYERRNDTGHPVLA